MFSYVVTGFDDPASTLDMGVLVNLVVLEESLFSPEPYSMSFDDALIQRDQNTFNVSEIAFRKQSETS